MKKVFLFLLFLFLINTVQAKTFETVTVGYWNNGGIWLGGVAPSYTSSDTLLIKHPILLNATLVLSAGAYLEIDSMGGVCGHEKITVNTNAKIIKYGILELDTLSIPGGNVSCLSPGSVILTCNGIISNGGSLSVGCPMAVGPWFTCHLPEYSYTTDVPSENSLSEFSISPNPFSTSTTVQITNYEVRNTSFEMYDVYGRMVKQFVIPNSSFVINRDGLASGLYFIALSTPCLSGSPPCQGGDTEGVVVATAKIIIIDK